jgi:hypothetical protein
MPRRTAMDPTTRSGASDTPRCQTNQFGSLDDRSRDENRQPEMSEPVTRTAQQGAEPDFWLVPDTRDDIVVSRISDY